MTLDDIQIGHKYECMVSNRHRPVYVEDKLPTGLIGVNLDTKREVFITKKDLTLRVLKEIESMDKWRLHNGD